MACNGEHKKMIKVHGVKGKCCDHYKEFVNIQLDLQFILSCNYHM